MKESLVKGDLNGVCYRTACDNTRAVWFNHSTHKHYCTQCAARINVANVIEAKALYGHALCTISPEYTGPE